MTVYEFTVIRCDEPRCKAKFPSGGKPMPAGWTHTRKQAVIAGWIWIGYPDGGDFCPEHAANGSQPESGQVMTERSENVERPCVVVPPGAKPWWDEPDLDYRRCGKPAVGERAGFAMCSEHMDVFDPSIERGQS